MYVLGFFAENRSKKPILQIENGSGKKILFLTFFEYINFLDLGESEMKRLISAGVISLISSLLLTACQPNNGDDETKRQLAELQQQLAQQQERDAERAAKEKEQELEKQQKEREVELRKQIEEDFKYQQMLEEEKKAMEKKAAQKAQSTNADGFSEKEPKKVKEKLARYPAVVITESGYGSLNLRGAPSTSAVVITKLQDGQHVEVVATTNTCTQAGCWVKVKANGLVGYVNDGYLQRY